VVPIRCPNQGPLLHFGIGVSSHARLSRIDQQYSLPRSPAPNDSANDIYAAVVADLTEDNLYAADSEHKGMSEPSQKLMLFGYESFGHCFFLKSNSVRKFIVKDDVVRVYKMIVDPCTVTLDSDDASSDDEVGCLM